MVGNAVLGYEKVKVDEGETEGHRRSHSVPLDSAVPREQGGGEERAVKCSDRATPTLVVKPKPIPIGGSAGGSLDDDGEEEEGSAQPFQFAKQEVGTDGQTRLVVIHTSDRKPLNQ